MDEEHKEINLDECTGKSRDLTEICSSLDIPSRKIDEGALDSYRKNRPSEETLVKYMAEIDALLKSNVVVMGGFCANPSVLGFRKMRRTSNDLDCVTDGDGIQSLKETFDGRLFRTENHGDVFLDYNGVPVGFDVRETHSWEVPQSLAYSSRRIESAFGGFNVISPEFLIALKARRSILKGRYFGKDALDTANLLLAPLYRDNLKMIDFERTGDLMRRHASDSLDVALSYLSFLSGYENHLRVSERSTFNGVMISLKSAVRNAYL
ncbi:MAG: hypothetical protein Q8P81_01220 [Nanoarchaeota archaeon]|nr:hypothetical protein [Nanoarchaeota archaeon]